MARLAWIDGGAPAATAVDNSGDSRGIFRAEPHSPFPLDRHAYIPCRSRSWPAMGWHTSSAGEYLEDLCMQGKGFQVCHLSSCILRP
jgi:hypothetical protein